MRRFTEEEIEYIKLNRGIVSFKDIAIALNRDARTVTNTSRKLFGKTCERGKSSFSRKVREYDCDDEFFNEINQDSAYWAGFIAADGNIKSNKNYNSIIVALASKDKGHLESFAKAINFNGPIHDYEIEYSYNDIESTKERSSITITSEQCKNKLEEYYNIVSNKSLILKPPKLHKETDMDAFINGYVDGDGSIYFVKKKKQKGICLSILGTKELLTWIQDRFSIILGININCIYKKRKDDKNTYFLTVSDKRARALIIHFYQINLFQLKRKWSEDVIDHCVNYKKIKKSKNQTKYMKVYQLSREYNNATVAKIMNLTPGAITWYQKQPLYHQIAKENSIDMEDMS